MEIQLLELGQHDAAQPPYGGREWRRQFGLNKCLCRLRQQPEAKRPGFEEATCNLRNFQEESDRSFQPSQRGGVRQNVVVDDNGNAVELGFSIFPDQLSDGGGFGFARQKRSKVVSTVQP